MARTEEEIRESLVESVHAIDESVDVLKGPVYDWMIRPVPPELQKTEADVERLVILTTHQFDRVVTVAEIRAMATSFSIRLGGGKSSKTKAQQFYTYTKPTTDDIQIDRGVLVGTEDQQFTFLTTEEASIPVNSADNFYNPQTRRYEITVDAEATSVGPEFDLPSTRVSRLLTPIEGVDGTTNILAYSGGAESEDLINSVARIQAKFAGLDPETGGGILSDIRNYDPENVTDVSLVYPKDRVLFKRGGNRPAIDAYVKGEDIDTVSETYTATGGELQVPLTYHPVRAVNGVTVNGSTTSFSFIQDTDPRTKGSPRSTDYVLLSSALFADDTVIISYDYNLLLWGVQTDLFTLERPFDTDVLVREPWDKPIIIEIDAAVVASLDTARAYTAIEAKLFELVESDYYLDVLQPDVIKQQIRDSVGRLSLLRIVKFKRASGGVLEVETIDVNKNESPSIDQAQLRINVRR